MRRRLQFTLLICLFLGGRAYPSECGDLGTQNAMDRCVLSELQKADNELNDAYNGYRSRLDVDQKRRFKDAQLAWVKFRDLACGFESSGVEGGSIHPFILRSCLARLTRTRLKELSFLANCKEGDLSCPAPK